MEQTFKVGDVIKFFEKVSEGKDGKDRTVAFTGQVLKVRGKGVNRSFTVRQILDGIEVDRIIPLSMPNLLKIQHVSKPKGKIHKAVLKRLVK